MQVLAMPLSLKSIEGYCICSLQRSVTEGYHLAVSCAQVHFSRERPFSV